MLVVHAGVDFGSFAGPAEALWELGRLHHYTEASRSPEDSQGNQCGASPAEMSFDSVQLKWQLRSLLLSQLEHYLAGALPELRERTQGAGHCK